jgi:hypothetical protein
VWCCVCVRVCLCAAAAPKAPQSSYSPQPAPPRPPPTPNPPQRYDQEEFGGAHEAHNPFAGAGDEDAQFARRSAEMQQRLRRKDGSVMGLAASKRRSELEKSLNAWEENRLLTSGVVRLKQARDLFSLFGFAWREA